MGEQAEQWIPAAQARDLLSSQLSNVAVAICTRAHAGLINARAKLLVVDGNNIGAVRIPDVFWWAHGHSALDQDWATGDFASSINQRVHMQAFGVSFGLDGLLELLPVERRAVVAKSVSVVAKPEWLSAIEARRFAYQRAGINPNIAAVAILDACRLGYVTARAVIVRRGDGGQTKNWKLQEREWDVPVWFWDNFTLPDSSTQDWERGIFSGTGRAPDGRCWLSLTGLFFLAESLNVLLPHDVQRAPATAPASKSGGRPPKEFWDDLWCAVWGKAFHGDLQPKRQADVERAMLEWAVINGHDVSESTVKPLARKMFAAMQDEGKNP